MAIHIDGAFMVLEIGERVVATARFSKRAAGNGNGASIVSSCPARLFTRNQAITALVVESMLASGRTADDPHMIALREGLR